MEPLSRPQRSTRANHTRLVATRVSNHRRGRKRSRGDEATLVPMRELASLAVRRFPNSCTAVTARAAESLPVDAGGSLLGIAERLNYELVPSQVDRDSRARVIVDQRYRGTPGRGRILRVRIDATINSVFMLLHSLVRHGLGIVSF